MDYPAVEVKNLRKRYGELNALDGISFTVRRGEIFGLLGPNGAGKTTTLECLEGLRRADSGQLRVMGVDPAREPRRLVQLIGVQLQTGALPDYIGVGEAMRLFSAYHGAAPDCGLLERLGLGEKMAAQYHTLSTGQKRRLALSLAVAHRPPVLFLDEPTAGLDVATRATLHEMMRELREEGATIVLSTHDMAEAEAMADRVAILLQGRIAAAGTPRELTAAGEGLTKISVRAAGSCLTGASFSGVARAARQGEYSVYFTASPGPVVAAIIAFIEASGDRLIDLRVERPTLEERFLELTNGTAQKEPATSGTTL
jgi:ABC-2 type transport system ATP-binding protein